MAVERDFDLLDDYLANRLNESDKKAFEEKMEADPELKQEFNVQQGLLQGIRSARTAELKSLLNTIPIPPVGTPTSLLIKAGTWTLISGLVITGVVYYFSNNDSGTLTSEPSSATQPEVKEVPPTSDKPTEQISTQQSEQKTEPSEAIKTTPSKEDKSVAVTSPVKPELKVYDPSKEVVDPASEEVRKYEQEQLEIISKAFVTSSIEVETENTDAKYSFHYMFNGGKLILYGAFEKHLYEILEFISDDKRTVVLFYRANYYLLDINKSKPTMLTAIKDRALLKKLSEYRGH